MKFIVRIVLSIYLISSCLLLKIRKPANTVDYLNSLFQDKNENNLPKEFINLNRILSESIMNQPATNFFRYKEKTNQIKNEAEKQIKNNEKKAEEKLEQSNHADKKDLSEKSKEEADKATTESNATTIEAPVSKSTNKYEGWLRIKSESFLNTRIFPSEHVQYDKDFFRVNNLNENQKEKFYFSLSENFLQYKSDEKSMNLLQVMRLEAIENLKYYPILYDNFGTNALHCADFLEKYDDLYTNFYKICSENYSEFTKFFCALAQLKSLTFQQCSDIPINQRPTELQVEIQNTQIIIPLQSKFCNENFNYKNHGEDWECLCKEGLSQSPIDLPKPEKALLSPVSPIFEFGEINNSEELLSADGLPKQTIMTQIKFENEVLKISKNNFGKIITLNSEIFIAKDIIFHTPSEHTIEGKRFDMEMQIIYSSHTGPNLGRSAVLVFLFEKKAGHFNKFLDDIDFYGLPNKNYITKNILNKLSLAKIFYNNLNSEKDFDKNEYPSAKPFSFYTYEGSITQPPCSEEAFYYIASEPLPVAGITIQLAQEALKSEDGFSTGDSEEQGFLDNKAAEGNYRVIQKLNGRKVNFYDHKKYSNNLSNFIVKNKVSEEGHFEKVKTKKKEVVFVQGDKPSDNPEKVMVEEDELRN